jgi:hypothetical protein
MGQRSQAWRRERKLRKVGFIVFIFTISSANHVCLSYLCWWWGQCCGLNSGPCPCWFITERSLRGILETIALITNNSNSTRFCLLNFVLGCMVIPIPWLYAAKPFMVPLPWSLTHGEREHLDLYSVYSVLWQRGSPCFLTIFWWWQSCCRWQPVLVHQDFLSFFFFL